MNNPTQTPPITSVNAPSVAVNYPTNTLKQKLGNGGFEYQRLLKAEQRLRASRQEFPFMAQRELQRINSGLYYLRGKDKSDKTPYEWLRIIFIAAVEIKSNSSMFTFDVTQKIAESLQFFTEHLADVNDDNIHVIDLHYQALINVFEQGNDFIIEGKRDEIMRTLQQAILAYKDKHKKI
jgi:hypothetical protein